MIKLNILRSIKKVSQKDLAKKIHTDQAHISRLENGDNDPRLSSIRSYVEGLGGDLEVIARFGGCSYVLDLEKNNP